MPRMYDKQFFEFIINRYAKRKREIEREVDPVVFNEIAILRRSKVYLSTFFTCIL